MAAAERGDACLRTPILMLLRGFRIQRLTRPVKAAEDAEKTTVFHYSKVKQVTPDVPIFDRTCLRECNIITSHSRGSVPIWRSPGRDQQSGPFEMQKTPRAKRFRQVAAFAVLGGALLIASPFAQSAYAQNAAPAAAQPVAPPAAAAPTAPSVAPTTPSAAPTSPAPA